MINVTSEDISLVKQNNQRRYVKLQVLNRELIPVGVIKGSLISGNIDIESSDNIRRTASISMKTEGDYVSTATGNLSIDLQRDMPVNYYIKLWCGIEDNNTLQVKWYSQGVFIINTSNYKYDPATRTLDISLVDMMYDLTGDRAGELHAYSTIVKNEQRIDDVVKNVLSLVGITNYNVEPVTVLRDINTPIDSKESSQDYMVPYDLDFSTGVTAYEILDKLVNLYPYYEMGFDANGVFFLRKELLEQDDSYAVIDGLTLADLVVSEDTEIDHSSFKNHIEVWGKDGLYYGEAEDNNPESPYQINSSPLRRLVVKDNEYGLDTNNICDKYKDDELQKQFEKEKADFERHIAQLEQIENKTPEDRNSLYFYRFLLSMTNQQLRSTVSIKGDDIAKQWAERILYDMTRMQDGVTIQTVMMPFLNDTDFKLSYRSKLDNVIRPYVVKSISHNLTDGKSTLTMIRFYNDQCINYWQQLDIPNILSCDVYGMSVVITADFVENAESYILYVDGLLVATYTSNEIVYQFTEIEVGSHTIKVAASAPYWRTSNLSEGVTIEVSTASRSALATDNSDVIITDKGYGILIAKE